MTDDPTRGEHELDAPGAAGGDGHVGSPPDPGDEGDAQRGAGADLGLTDPSAVEIDRPEAPA